MKQVGNTPSVFEFGHNNQKDREVGIMMYQLRRMTKAGRVVALVIGVLTATVSRSAFRGCDP